MRKNIWIIVSGLVCFSACRSVQAPQLIGGNKDEHGCLTAAGYTWSELAGTVSAFLKTVCGWTTRLCNPL